MVKKQKIDILAIIQARMSSTRLSGKVLLPLGNKTVLENVCQRVSRSKRIDKTVVAATTNPNDDKLVSLCEEKGIAVERGSEKDVLDRYYKVAKKYSPDYVIRITADCPLIDPRVIDQVIALHFKEQNDYTTNAYYINETYPDGEDVEIVSINALAQAWQRAKPSWQREHPTQYITQNPQKFKIGNLVYKENLRNKRWTLDEPGDYLFFKEIYQALDSVNNFSMEDVLKYLKMHPELEKTNHQIIRNEGLKKSIKESAPSIMKGKSYGKRTKIIQKG